MHSLGLYCFPFTAFYTLQYYSMKTQVVNKLLTLCMDYSFYGKKYFPSWNDLILYVEEISCANIFLVNATATDITLHDWTKWFKIIPYLQSTTKCIYHQTCNWDKEEHDVFYPLLTINNKKGIIREMKDCTVFCGVVCNDRAKVCSWNGSALTWNWVYIFMINFLLQSHKQPIFLLYMWMRRELWEATC